MTLRLTPIAAAFVMLLAAVPGLAQQTTSDTPSLLSTVLVSHGEHAEDYPLGLMWNVPREVAAQQRARLQLQNALARYPALASWLSSRPITGRVNVALADARWLQANPTRDPRLLPGHQVLLPQRPQTVTVLLPDGTRCQVRHTSGRHALDYIRACHTTRGPLIDWVWMAQPDGQVRRFGSGLWNEEPQEEPAPGAWLWAPVREDNIDVATSDALITFLATQGPALDANQQATPLYPGTAPGPLAATTADTAPRPAPEPSSPAPQSIAINPGDWGSMGLLQTPTARSAPEGEVRFTTSRVAPYTRINVFAQPLPGLEAGFRYTSITNRLYGPEDFSGNQTYKDKSLDVKFNLLTETARQPALAVGFRDITGTGFFSGEYLVANKRVGITDWSAGLAWGYGSGARGFKNPLSALSSHFEKRDTATGEAGKFSISNYFAGPTAFFGGVAIQVPDQPLTVKIEYDGNDYQAEPQTNNQPQRSHLNVGLTWRASRHADLSVGIERGNTLMVSLNLHTALNRLSVGKFNDPSPIRIAPPGERATNDWSATLADLRERTDWRASQIEQRGRELRVTLTEADATYWRERVDTASAVLNRDAGAEIDQLTFAYSPNGVPVGEHIVDRDLWLTQKMRPVTPAEQTTPVFARAPQAVGDARLVWREPRPVFESGLGLNLNQTLGGPDGFALYQLVASLRARLNIAQSTWLQSTIELGLIDNYDTFRYTAPSQLPRVRTYAREFITTSRVRLANLQATHVGRLDDDQFYSVYGGYLESMYAGIGGEWLYRPFASKLAFGIDANAVQQRDFAQDFGLRDYRVTTGHATLYWDTGWKDVQLNLSAGKYLAGDLGATLEFSRSFDNGVTMAAYFTKTNVSSAQFGEGSFDKGIYVSVPFDAFLTKTSKDTAFFNWRPLTRDGGAKLGRPISLYGLTRARDTRALHYASAPLPSHETTPADHVAPPLSAPAERPAPADLSTGLPVTGKPLGLGNPAFERRLAGALNFHDFHNVRFHTENATLEVSLTSDNIRPYSRAANRAALIMLRAAPATTRAIHITFEENGAPVMRYEFFNLERLDDFYSGLIDDTKLMPYIAVRVLDANYASANPLARFDDERKPEDEPTLANIAKPVTRPVTRAARDLLAAGTLARDTDWRQPLLIGGGLIVASHLLDKRLDDLAAKHPDNALLKGATHVGNGLPLLMTGAAAAQALLTHNPTQQRVAFAATEASVSALIASSVLKQAIARERPKSAANGSDGSASFPSNHAAMAWAVVTPYAIEYRMPLLYAAPMLTQFARVQERKHWFSDTVAGGLLGYSLGRLFYESSKREASAPRVWATLDEIGVSWLF